MENRKPTLLEILNYSFGTNTNDISKVDPEKIIEYSKKNPVKTWSS